MPANSLPARCTQTRTHARIHIFTIKYNILHIWYMYLHIYFNRVHSGYSRYAFEILLFLLHFIIIISLFRYFVGIQSLIFGFDCELCCYTLLYNNDKNIILLCSLATIINYYCYYYMCCTLEKWLQVCGDSMWLQMCSSYGRIISSFYFISLSLSHFIVFLNMLDAHTRNIILPLRAFVFIRVKRILPM